MRFLRVMLGKVGIVPINCPKPDMSQNQCHSNMTENIKLSANNSREYWVQKARYIGSGIGPNLILLKENVSYNLILDVFSDLPVLSSGKKFVSIYTLYIEQVRYRYKTP